MLILKISNPLKLNTPILIIDNILLVTEKTNELLAQYKTKKIYLLKNNKLKLINKIKGKTKLKLKENKISFIKNRETILTFILTDINIKYKENIKNKENIIYCDKKLKTFSFTNTNINNINKSNSKILLNKPFVLELPNRKNLLNIKNNNLLKKGDKIICQLKKEYNTDNILETEKVFCNIDRENVRFMEGQIVLMEGDNVSVVVENL